MADLTYSTWLTKQQAADAIGVSTKLVEQLAKEKKLQSTKRQRPESGAWISVYHPDDVDRLRKERNPEAPPFTLPAVAAAAQVTPEQNGASPNAVALRQQSPAEFFRALAAAVAGNAQRQPRLFLTIPEAADYSGLPQAHIRRLMAEGKLTGLKTGAGWRIRRADLKKL